MPDRHAAIAGHRRFGSSDVTVSTFTFGSMRLDGVGRADAAWLLAYLHERGVTTFHSSHEYAGHDMFCALMRMLRKPVVHVAKIAVPHFEERDFSAVRFREHVDRELTALGVGRLDIVQWLVRSKPIADVPRLGILQRCAEEMARVWEALVAEGKVGVLTSFPYSPTFAAAALAATPCAGLVSYLNVVERELVPLLDDMATRGQGLLAIRPLCAGQLPADVAVGEALRFPLLHPAVASVVVSVSSVAHAAEVLDALGDPPSDRVAFHAAVTRHNEAARASA